MSVASKRLQQLSTRPRRVEVEWIDSSGHAGWKFAQDILQLVEQGTEALTCHTVGFLVDEREESITVALSYTIDTLTGLHDQYGEAMTIPRVAIVEIRDLRR